MNWIFQLEIFSNVRLFDYAREFKCTAGVAIGTFEFLIVEKIHSVVCVCVQRRYVKMMRLASYTSV